MECLMFPGESALLAAPRAAGKMLTIEGPTLGVQSLVALLVFLAKLVMDPPMHPALMSKGQGSREQQSREGQDGKGDFLQVGRHEMAPSCIGKFAPTLIAGVWREDSLSVWRCDTIVRTLIRIGR
jgi:hypothetical protein